MARPDILIAVKSCVRDKERGDHEIIRGTWGRDATAAGILVKFFVGIPADRPTRASSRLREDEIEVSVKDDYSHLTHKTQAICQSVSGKMVKHLFLCDTDTFVDIPGMLKSAYRNYDYYGYFNGQTTGTFSYDSIDREGNHDKLPAAYPWASGGFGYFLSYKALNVIAYEFMKAAFSEDLQVGQTLGPLIAEGELTVGNTKDDLFSAHFPSSYYKHNYDEVDGWAWMKAGGVKVKSPQDVESEKLPMRWDTRKPRA
jgi:hypothetical protein